MKFTIYFQRSVRWVWLLALFLQFGVGIAQTKVPICRQETLPDGTTVYVADEVTVPELTVKRAATLGTAAEDDDLQAFINAASITRSSDTIVVDLSQFTATTRNSTLTFSTGKTYLVKNGTLKRGSSLTKYSPLISITDNTSVTFDSTVTISGENLTTNGTAIQCQGATVATAAQITNLDHGVNSSSSSFAISCYSSSVYVCGGYCDGIHNSGSKVSLLHGTIMSGVFSDRDVYLNCGEDCDAIVNQFTPEDDVILILGAGGVKKGLSYYYTDTSAKYNNFVDGKITVLGYGCSMTADVQPTGAYLPTNEDLQLIHFSGTGYNTSGLVPTLEPGRIVLREPAKKSLQEYIDSLPTNSSQTVNLDDYETITEPITIPEKLRVTLKGSKKLTIGAAFKGDYLFKTEKNARLSFEVPDIVWETGTTLPSTIFHAAGEASYINLVGVANNQLACSGTLIQVEDSAKVGVSTDIGGDAIRVNSGGVIYISKPETSLDSYVKAFYQEEGRASHITGNVHFDTMEIRDTLEWKSDDAITFPTNLVLGRKSQIDISAKTLTLPSTSLVMDDTPEERVYITFKRYGGQVFFNNLKCTQPDGYSPRMDEKTGTDYQEYQLSFEHVDQELNTKFSQLLDDLLGHITAFKASLSDAYARVKTVSDDAKRLSFNEELDQLTMAYEAVYVQYEEVIQLYSRFYGVRSVEEYTNIVDNCSAKMESLRTELASLNAKIEEALASTADCTPESNDDLQDFLDSMVDDNTKGTEDRPAIVELPDSVDLTDITIHEDLYIIFRPELPSITGLRGNHWLHLHPRPNKPAFVIKPGAHVTIEDLQINCDDTDGGTQYIYVDGTLVIEDSVRITGEREDLSYIYVSDQGKMEWKGELPKGRMENHGEVVQKKGIIDVYYNYGTHHHEGGRTHHVYNHQIYYLTDGIIGPTDTTATHPAIENHGEMHLTGGNVVGYGKTLIIHYHILYIDGVKLDDSHVDHTIEAYADFHTRGDVPYRHIVLDRNVKVYIITRWTVVWHITFIDDILPKRQIIFVFTDDDIPDNFPKYIDYDLPKHYRWYYNKPQRSIEVRDEKIHDEDDLQAFIDGLDDDPGTEQEPRDLDGEGNEIPWREIPLGKGEHHIHVHNITFVIPEGRPSSCLWEIPSDNNVRLSNVVFSATQPYSEVEEHYIIIYGRLTLGDARFHHCHLQAYAPIYLGEALQDTIYLNRIVSDGELYEGLTAVLPDDTGYRLTEADASRIIHPATGMWHYRLGENGNIELAAGSVDAIDAIRIAEARIYIDTTGRLQVSGLSADTPCRILTIDGQQRYAGTISGASAISLVRGCYLLQIGNTITKIVR